MVRLREGEFVGRYAQIFYFQWRIKALIGEFDPIMAAIALDLFPNLGFPYLQPATKRSAGKGIAIEEGIALDGDQHGLVDDIADHITEGARVLNLNIHNRMGRRRG